MLNAVFGSGESDPESAPPPRPARKLPPLTPAAFDSVFAKNDNIAKATTSG